MTQVSGLFEAMRSKGLLPREMSVVIETTIGATPNESSGSQSRRLTVETDPDQVIATAQGLGVDLRRTLDGARHRLWRVRNNIALTLPPTPELLAGLAGPAVRSVRPARIHRTQLNEVAVLHELAAEAVEGSPIRPTGRGILVAVVDSGIDRFHPDFHGRIDPRCRCFVPGLDPSAIDDAAGHGTHVAGILCGAGAVYRGIAPEAELLVVRVFDASGQANEAVVAAGIAYAAECGADIINYSGGYAPVVDGIPFVDPPWVWRMQETKEEREIRLAAETGAVCVVAAGNHGGFGKATISNPAISTHCIAVGSVDKRGLPSSFSSWGPVYRSQDLDEANYVAALAGLGSKAGTRTRPDLAAVGGEVSTAGECFHASGVISASMSGYGGACRVSGQPYRFMSGTSQAAPVVSGLVALIFERLKALPGPLDRPTMARLAKRVLRQSSTGVKIPRSSWRVGAGIPKWRAIEVTLGALS